MKSTEFFQNTNMKTDMLYRYRRLKNTIIFKEKDETRCSFSKSHQNNRNKIQLSVKKNFVQSSKKGTNPSG